MKQSNFFRSYSTLLFIWLLVFTGSCKKADDFYLEGNTPEAPFGATIDTLALPLRTELQKPGLIRTDNLNYDLLGTFIDPIFGRTTGNVYAQVSLKQYNPTFTATSKFDSFLLYIKVDKNTFTGNLSDVQKWKVYRLEERLENGQNYYADSKFAVSTNTIGSFSGNVNPGNNLIKISLDSAFANTFFRENKNSFGDNASFGNFLKGIAVIPDTAGLANGKGALVKIDLSDTTSKMVLYYDATRTFTMQFAGNKRVNTFSHNYTGTQVGNALASGQNNFFGKAYIQGSSGVRTFVDLSNLDSIARSGDIALYKAELIFTKTDSIADQWNNQQPGQLFIIPRDKNGDNSQAGFIDGAVDYYDGKYRPADKTYRFVITNHIQQLLKNYKSDPGFTSNGLNLFVPVNEFASPNRAVISAAKSGNSSPKLILTFTKLGE